MPLTDEKRGWVLKFHEECQTETPMSILNHLIQMGVEGPEKMKHKDPDEEVYYDPDFNLHVWNVLSATNNIQRIRRALKDDLRRKGSLECYGKITHKGYGQMLLDEFVTERPNPSWFGKN